MTKSKVKVTVSDMTKSKVKVKVSELRKLHCSRSILSAIYNGSPQMTTGTISKFDRARFFICPTFCVSDFKRGGILCALWKCNYGSSANWYVGKVWWVVLDGMTVDSIQGSRWRHLSKISTQEESTVSPARDSLLLVMTIEGQRQVVTYSEK